ncbi:unnamed protein product [Hyaloperonospora brassicae]|uniref:glucose-6-phosphate 1-epimerase n=1 Tax=Hyaloperonospora brassicae TaxID=162125 RepID=A0AAV0TAB7_HYABA|nr:unnamed protein product [Hyaloperonospora brassicae]
MVHSFLLKTAALVSSTMLASTLCASSPGAANELVTVMHPSGATAKVSLLGAQVLSYTTTSQPDVNVLFVSQSPTNGANPVRGGISVNFPIVESVDSFTGPEHGFARTSMWTLESLEQPRPDHGVDYTSATFILTWTEATFQIWPEKFELRYKVNVSADRLLTKLTVSNLGSAAFYVGVLLTSYLSVPDVLNDGVVVRGLQGLEYYDRVTRTNQTDSREMFGITSQVDSAYKDVGLDVVASVKGVGFVQDVAVRQFAQYGNGNHRPISDPSSCVVWNPWTEGAKAGLGVEEYRKMLAIGCGKVTEKFVQSTDVRYTVSSEITVTTRSA